MMASLRPIHQNRILFLLCALVASWVPVIAAWEWMVATVALVAAQ